MAAAPHDADAQQTSFRFEKTLFAEFKNAVHERNAKMGPTLEALMRLYVADPSIVDELVQGGIDTSSAVDLQRAFVRFVPAVVIVKGREGHVVYANEGFLDLVQRKDVIGLRPRDYLSHKATADQIAKYDERVRKEKVPLLCAEHIPIGERTDDNIHKRITIRFPIWVGGEIEFTGTLGFDVGSVSLAALLDPKAKGAARAVRFPYLAGRRDAAKVVGVPLLNAFIESLPAIATVKSNDGTLLLVNKEYEDVTGKTRASVLNSLPTSHWPESVGRAMMTHDLLVRETRQSYVTLDILETGREESGLRGRQPRIKSPVRINIRFPIFNSAGSLVLTGSFGFDREVFVRGHRMIETLSVGELDCEPL